MKVDESTWKFMQKHLGFNDEELELFRNNPRTVDIVSKAPALMKKTIVAEVVASHGCNSQHKVGDRFYFDGSGNLLTKYPELLGHPRLNCGGQLIKPCPACQQRPPYTSPL